MNALDEGIERHKQLEEMFAGSAPVEPEMPARINWRAELQKIIDRQRPTESGIELTIDENVYRRVIAELDQILDGGKPTLKIRFEETLRNDGVYEYTSTGSCDGSETYNFRRQPEISANPSSWEPIDSIPEEAKYNND